MTTILIKKEALSLLHNRVKMYRVMHNLNQQELGQKVSVSRQTISLIERGDYNPSITLALKIAKIFNVSVEEIFYLEDMEDKHE